MSVLVDTSVWSLALRRHQPVNDPVTNELRRLIQADQVQMIGPIRQELLSGIREKAQFEKLQENLRAFPDLPIATSNYERAADFFNIAQSITNQVTGTSEVPVTWESWKIMSKQKQSPQFAICINTNDPDVLTPRMIYRVLPDESASRSNHIRVIDNEGEDYLYPTDYFILVDLPRSVKNQLLPAFQAV